MEKYISFVDGAGHELHPLDYEDGADGMARRMGARLRVVTMYMPREG